MREVKNKKSNLLKYIVSIIGIILISLGIFFVVKSNRNYKDEAKENEQVSLKDDFYDSINYETLKKAVIPKDSAEWSKVYDVEKVIEDRVNDITDEILLDANYNNSKIDILLELFNDYDTRNRNKYSEIQKYIDMVDNAKTVEEFNKVSFVLNRDMNIDTIIVGKSTTDIYDDTKHIFVFDQLSGDLNGLELYGNSKYSRYKDAFIELRKKFLSELGYDDEKIENISNEIDEFNDYMYSNSLKNDDYTSIEKQLELYENKYTLEELKNEFNNIPIVEYLQKRGIDNLENYTVFDLNQLKSFDEYYQNHLDIIKEITKIKIISQFFTIPEEGEKYIVDFNNKLSNTQKTIDDYRKNEILEIKMQFIDDEIQKRYEEKYFKKEDKKEVSDLVSEVKEYYKDLINSSSWLSDNTKSEAINKLEKMKVNIGYQEKNKKDKEEYTYVSKKDGGTLISNMIGKFRFNYDHFSEEFNKESESENLSTLNVNASYNPQDNSINFYAGFKGLYEDKTNYYERLGYFGIVIAHEISHAFDNNGSMFDEYGKLREWWTEDDRLNYKQLSKKIEDYYSKYEYMGFKVDGKLTLGENIADLAAMKTIISIAESKGATKDDFKKIFEGYADLWVSKTNKEYAETIILMDTHSPNKVRVNAVLSSMDKFYEVYDIKEGDKMFVPKEERVGLW